MDEDNPEKAKSERALRILLFLMTVGVLTPLVLFYFTTFGSKHP